MRCEAPSPWTASCGAASARCGSPAAQTSTPVRSPSSAGSPRTLLLASKRRRSAQRPSPKSQTPTSWSPGVLVLDQRGRVSQYTWAAERWLRELGDLRLGWQEARSLPSAVWSVVGALQRALSPGTDRDQNGVPRLLIRGRSGRWLALHGARTEPYLDRESETMVVIEQAVPREVAWLRTSAYALSSREREVVDLVVRGLSTKQISKTLYISEYTDQEHLSNVFDKVGVRGRRALVKRLYLDSLFFSEDSKQRR